MTESSATLPSVEELRERARTSLARIGATLPDGNDLQARSPIVGDDLLGMRVTTAEEPEKAVAAADEHRLPIGNPYDETTLVGPLITDRAGAAQAAALERAQAEGGKVVVGGARRDLSAGVYVEPAIVRMPAQTPVVREETFAPILNVLTCDTFDEAIALHNDVLQGLSSSIFTRDQQEAERFLAADRSVCGIANVNIGTSGAETAGRSAGRRRPAEAASPDRTPGGPACAARSKRSNTPAIWRWLRPSASSDIHIFAHDGRF
jgi:hypothetical protein